MPIVGFSKAHLKRDLVGHVARSYTAARLDHTDDMSPFGFLGSRSRRTDWAHTRKCIGTLLSHS